jgi:hypothetical protein
MSSGGHSGSGADQDPGEGDGHLAGPVEDLAFDAVLLAREDGAVALTAAQFLAMPLAERARALLENRVEFHRHGHPVPQVEVMKTLMRQALR